MGAAWPDLTPASTLVGRPSTAPAVAEVHDAAAEPTLVHQLEVGPDAGGQRALPGTHEDGHEEQVALVDQARGDRAAAELGAPDREVGRSALLHLLDRRRVELALDAGS